MDSETWQLVDTFYLNQSDASGFYEGDFVADIGGRTGNYILITALDNYGGDCYGLSEIKFGLTPPDEPCENKIAMELVLAPDIIGSIGDIVFVSGQILYKLTFCCPKFCSFICRSSQDKFAIL